MSTNDKWGPLENKWLISHTRETANWAGKQCKNRKTSLLFIYLAEDWYLEYTKHSKIKKNQTTLSKKNELIKWTYSSQEIKHKWPKEKCLALLAIGEMQIKTTLRFCLSPVKMTVI